MPVGLATVFKGTDKNAVLARATGTLVRVGSLSESECSFIAPLL